LFTSFADCGELHVIIFFNYRVPITFAPDEIKAQNTKGNHSDKIYKRTKP